MNRTLSLMVACAALACGPEVEVSQVGPVEVGVDGLPSRPFRRMNIDQLAASMERVSGYRWTEMQSEGTVELFSALSGSLGKPDYLSSTHEDLAPALLFQKFLDDASRSICTRWAEGERTLPPSSRTLMALVDLDDTPEGDPGAVAQNMAALLLRFHGVHVPPGDPRQQPWITLLSRASEATGDPVLGWRTVCIGLFSHPDFYSF